MPNYDSRTQETEQVKWQAFQDWMHLHQFPTNGLVFHQFAETGRGLMVTADTTTTKNKKEQLVILCIPMKRCIQPLDALVHFPALQPHFHNSMTPISRHTQQLLLALTLCHHRHIKDEWSAYINVLPESYPQLAYFTPIDVLEWMPLEFQHCAQTQSKDVIDAYTAVLTLFLEEDVWIPSQRLFVWAWFTVHTRCITRNDKGGDQTKRLEMILVPFLDFLNHCASAQQDGAGFDQAYVDHDLDSFVLAKIKKEEEGDGSGVLYPGIQVFLNYGPHDNMYSSFHSPIDFYPQNTDSVSLSTPLTT